MPSRTVKRSRARHTVSRCALVVLAASGTACHKDAPPDALLTAKAINSCVEVMEVGAGYSVTYTIRELFVPVAEAAESVARSQGHEIGIVYRPRARTQKTASVRRVIEVSRPVMAVADMWSESERQRRRDPAPRARLIRHCREGHQPVR